MNRRIALVAGENIIGRDPAANVWLDYATIWRRPPRRARHVEERRRVRLRQARLHLPPVKRRVTHRDGGEPRRRAVRRALRCCSRGVYPWISARTSGRRLRALRNALGPSRVPGRARLRRSWDPVADGCAQLVRRAEARRACDGLDRQQLNSAGNQQLDQGRGGRVS